MPMKIGGGSGGPVRIVVELPDPATTESPTGCRCGRKGQGRGHRQGRGCARCQRGRGQ